MDPRYDPVTSVVSDEDMSSQLTGLMNVTELASNHQLYAVGRALQVYWMGVLIPVGVLGNLLSLVVLLQPHNRRISFCIYLATLAVCDLLLMLVAATAWVDSLRDDKYAKDAGPKAPLLQCAMFVYCFHYFSQAGTMMVMAMSVDRFIAICYPFHAPVYCRRRRTIIIISTLLVFQVAFCLPHLFLARFVNKVTCATFARDDRGSLIYVWVSLVVNVAVPFTIILGTNICVINTLWTRFDWLSKRASTKGTTRRCGTPQAQRTLPNSDNRKHGESRKRDVSQVTSRDRQLICILLLVTFSFLLLTLPQYVRYVVYIFVDYSQSPETKNVHFFAYHITNKLYYTNSVINFALYCIAGRGFRRDIIQLIRALFASTCIRNRCVASTPKTPSTTDSSVGLQGFSERYRARQHQDPELETQAKTPL